MRRANHLLFNACCAAMQPCTVANLKYTNPLLSLSTKMWSTGPCLPHSSLTSSAMSIHHSGSVSAAASNKFFSSRHRVGMGEGDPRKPCSRAAPFATGGAAEPGSTVAEAGAADMPGGPGNTAPGIIPGSGVGRAVGNCSPGTPAAPSAPGMGMAPGMTLGMAEVTPAIPNIPAAPIAAALASCPASRAINVALARASILMP
mmetsp:Transcript_19465/g.37289  ORF Transcript_19465/g.37289 Transcript_19465/m.37289 type:complete len:202 (+) Transcript_19465:909-1514(+)